MPQHTIVRFILVVCRSSVCPDLIWLIIFVHSCSAECFSKHQQTCVPIERSVPTYSTEDTSKHLDFTPATSVSKEIPAALQGIPRVEAEYSDRDALSRVNPLPMTALEKLDRDEHVRLALGSDELRSIIHTINTAEDPAWRSALLQQQLRDNPFFLEFMEHVFATTKKE